MRGRGLKHLCQQVVDVEQQSPPMRGRGLKPRSSQPKPELSESPPMRGRGLKLPSRDRLLRAPFVAPHAGAWIETLILKCGGMPPAVAPHAGAWIETAAKEETAPILIVAPHAGAWIETLKWGQEKSMVSSPPMRGRGLKLNSTIFTHMTIGRPPCGGVD